jgi:poly-gamma-glutamate synthesis protein (capsule biosynthesis protein)
MRFWLWFCCAALACSCQKAPEYVKIVDTGAHEPERIFLESLFQGEEGLESLGLRLFSEGGDGVQGNPRGPRPGFFIDILSSWEYEAAFGDILISRSPLVPRDDALSGRTGTSLDACREGRERLVPPGAVEPPFVALRVGGQALGDRGYPLIRAAGIRIRGEAGKQLKGRRLERFRLLEETLRKTPKPLVLQTPEPVWIAAGGDLMLDRGATEILLNEGPAGIFGETAAILAAADISLVNLEGVVSRRGEKVKKSFNFRFIPETAPALRASGIDAVLHANNHVYDYGGEAFLDSLSWLSGAGIGTAGAGINDAAAAEPAVFERKAGTFRVFGLASFPRERNGWDGAAAAAGPGRAGMLHAARGGGEKLKAQFAPAEDPRGITDIVLFHGGVEWSRRPDGATRELYTDLVRAGADLVIGSHPHIVQGFEWVLGKPVFWSLGNYVFGGMENTEGGEEGLFIRLGYWEGRLLYLEPFALSLSHTRTEIAPAEKLETFYRRSRELREHPPPGTAD